MDDGAGEGPVEDMGGIEKWRALRDVLHRQRDKLARRDLKTVTPQSLRHNSTMK